MAYAGGLWNNSGAGIRYPGRMAIELAGDGARYGSAALEESLEEIRREIDAADDVIVNALRRRMDLSARVGAAKANNGGNVYAPAREAEVIARVLAANDGRMPEAALAAIYSQILAASRGLQQRARVAFLGPEHTFSHQAARNLFLEGAEYHPTRSIREIFGMTDRDEADYGVVPIENSTAGTVGETLDTFVESKSRIVAETTLAITHNLISKYPIGEVKIVYSHPQALAQCQDWLTQNLGWADRVEVGSTAAAGGRAAREEGAAAIGVTAVAEDHGLKVLRTNIQDFSENQTRFFILGKSPNPATGNDRTALVFAVPDRVGSLHDALGTLRQHGVNLSNLQTRPARGRSEAKAGDYVFFAEIAGHEDDEDLAEAIQRLRGQCTLVKVLGSWPATGSQLMATGG